MADYSDAYLTGDGPTAYALLSRRCQERLPRSSFVALVQELGRRYGSPLPFKSIGIAVSGRLARVSYTYSVSEIHQDAEPWVREDGSWHEDDC